MNYLLLASSLFALSGCVSLTCANPSEEFVDPIPQWEHPEERVNYTPELSKEGPGIFNPSSSPKEGMILE